MITFLSILYLAFIAPVASAAQTSNGATRMNYALAVSGKAVTSSDPQHMVDVTLDALEKTKIPPQAVAHWFLNVTDAAPEWHQKLIDLGIQGDFQLAEAGLLPENFRRIGVMQARVTQCTAAGFHPADCCDSLLLPSSMFSTWSDLSANEKEERLFEAYFNEQFWQEQASLQIRRLGARAFKTRGLDSWLAICGPLQQQTPDTLADWKMTFGDFKDWREFFLPVSHAKRMGRRFYRSPDGRFAIAETVYVGPESMVPMDRPLRRDPNTLDLDVPDCTVLETEIIETLPDGTLSFSTYNKEEQLAPFSFFVDYAFTKETALPTPFSCIGCHFDPDTGVIEVRFPNPEDLTLDFETAPAPLVRRDASHCQSAP